jgi:CBS domain-containing protein
MRAMRSSNLPTLSFPQVEETEGLPAPTLCTVDEVMAREVLAVRPDISLRTAAELMLEHAISGMPVVDEDGQLVGMLSKTDVVRHGLEDDVEASVELLPTGQHYLDGTTAGDVMTRQVLTVPEGLSLAMAAKIMVNAGVHRVPVVSATGALVGQLSTTDIVRWVAGLP